MVLFNMDDPIKESNIDLTVMYFIEGLVIFEAQAKVQGESCGDTPVVLDICAIGITPATKLIGPSIPPSGVDIAKPEIRLRRTGQVGNLDSAQGAIVSRVGIIQTLPPVLKSGVDGVAAVSNDHPIFNLPGPRLEVLDVAVLAVAIGESGDTDCRQARTESVRPINANLLAQVALSWAEIALIE